MNKKIVCVCLGVLAVSAGCRAKETYLVSGKVSFNGEAVSNGEIQLLPADHEGAPAAGRIENGEYRLQAKPGPKRVEIRAARADERNVPNSLGPAFRDYIPAEFNSASTLSADVAASDNNHFDFHLKAAGRP